MSNVYDRYALGIQKIVQQMYKVINYVIKLNTFSETYED